MKYKNKKKYSISWIHNWVYENLGKPNNCSFNSTHKTTQFEWSNISGEYKLEKDDWQQLCPSCHRKFDFKEETRQKISKSHIGLINAKTRKIKQYDLMGNFIQSFNMIKDAHIKLNIGRTAIMNNLLGLSKRAGNYQFKYI